MSKRGNDDEDSDMNEEDFTMFDGLLDDPLAGYCLVFYH